MVVQCNGHQKGHFENILVSTTLLLQPCYSSLHLVQDKPGEPETEDTFSHSHLSWSSITPYLLHPSITINGILSVQLTCLTVFFPQSLYKYALVYLLTRHRILHTRYISSPNYCLLFTAHARTITTSCAVVPRLYHLILSSLSNFYLETNIAA